MGSQHQKAKRVTLAVILFSKNAELSFTIHYICTISSTYCVCKYNGPFFKCPKPVVVGYSKRTPKYRISNANHVNWKEHFGWTRRMVF